MTPAEAQALADVRGYALAGRVEVKRHAAQRMRERRVSAADLRSALTRATRCKAQPGDHWRVSGPDAEGDELTVVVAIEAGVVVVTLF